jgi:hypothetical protein
MVKTKSKKIECPKTGYGQHTSPNKTKGFEKANRYA